jgi:transposase-like protein
MTMPIVDHMSKPRADAARRIEVFTGAGRRREWSAEQNAAILAESYAGTRSVCDVARRHGLIRRNSSYGDAQLATRRLPQQIKTQSSSRQ